MSMNQCFGHSQKSKTQKSASRYEFADRNDGIGDVSRLSKVAEVCSTSRNFAVALRAEVGQTAVPNGPPKLLAVSTTSEDTARVASASRCIPELATRPCPTA